MRIYQQSRRGVVISPLAWFGGLAAINIIATFGCATSKQFKVPEASVALRDELDDSPRLMCYHGMVEYVTALVRRRDRKEISRFIDRIEARWPDEDIEMYANVINELCGRLGTDSGNQTEEDRELVDRATNNALSRVHRIPLDVATDLAIRLPAWPNREGSAIPSSQLRGVRRQAVEIWKVIIERFDLAIDPRWDPDPEKAPSITDIISEHPEFNQTWPPGPLDDPNEQARYNRLTRELRAKVVAWHHQHHLREELASFLPLLEWTVAEAYSHQPYDWEEAVATVNVIFKQADARSRVLDEIRRNTEG